MGSRQSSQQSWLKRSDWQQGIAALEDRASIEVILHCLHESVKHLESPPAERPLRHLEYLLGIIQGHLGCQGIGLFSRNPEWEAAIKLGGRSLGKPDPDWLDQVQRKDSCGFVPDVPATGWGQIASPFRGAMETLHWEVLVVSGRYINEKSLATVALLVQFLEPIGELVSLSCTMKDEVAKLSGLCRHFTDLLHAQSPDQLLELLAEQATSLLGCERATIFIRDSRTGQLVGSPATGLEDGSLIIPEETGIVGEVVQTGKALIVADVESDSRFENLVDRQTGFRTRNILCVPLFEESGNVVGAFECLNKSAGCFTERDRSSLELLARHATISILQAQAEQELLSRQREMQSEKSSQCELVGESVATQAVRSSVESLCSSRLPVLITGETGTGKETVARALHYRGDRSDQPFVVIDCSHWAGPPEPEKQTCFLKELERADGGTLFLDDIDLLACDHQRTILALMEQGRITEAESAKGVAMDVDIRVIAATQSQLMDQVLEGKFQEELYLRLKAVSINLPPLRERQDDIEPLILLYLEIYRKQAKRKSLTCSPKAMERLVEYSWPGNVRELKNMAERLAFVGSCDEISPENIALLCGMEMEGSNASASEGLAEATLDFQQRYIRLAIARSKGNMTAAARMLGLHRSNLYRKMRQLKMAEAKQEQE